MKNSIVQINKIASIDRFYKTETDGEFIFQQLIISMSRVNQSFFSGFIFYR
ncbi:hypothetical protein LEP1GSC021_3494 [Leptospira noguchii str. 1993005606]|nr:hypothetical protein LEP1GSC021_3494 [Leptospira noguchii str. 1993005606]